MVAGTGKIFLVPSAVNCPHFQVLGLLLAEGDAPGCSHSESEESSSQPHGQPQWSLPHSSPSAWGVNSLSWSERDGRTPPGVMRTRAVLPDLCPTHVPGVG